MARRPPVATQTDREMEDQMLAVAGDEERVEVIGIARDFKRSWIELADALTRVRNRELWKKWGFDDFEHYCSKELHIKKTTAAKLVGSYAFLRSSAPRVIERSRDSESAAPVPSLEAVSFVARAKERGAADADTMREIRKAAFDEGADRPLLSRRFNAVAFPVDRDERAGRLRKQLATTARRLADLVAEPDIGVPRKVAIAVEEAVGRLLEAIDD